MYICLQFYIKQTINYCVLKNIVEAQAEELLSKFVK